MATKVSLAVRSNDAYRRIEAAMQHLAASSGVKDIASLDFRHRDPAIEQVTRIELLADNLEKIGIALHDAESNSKGKAKK